MPVTRIQPSPPRAPDILHSGPMTLLWLRLAVLLYGVAALAVLPAALYDRPRWRLLAVPSCRGRRPLPLCLAGGDPERRPPSPAGRDSRGAIAAGAHPRVGLSAGLRALPQRLHRDIRPAHCLYLRHAGRIPPGPGDVFRSHSHRLDSPPYRPAAGRLWRTGGLAAGLVAVPDSGTPPEVEVDRAAGCRRWTRRWRRSIRSP